MGNTGLLEAPTIFQLSHNAYMMVIRVMKNVMPPLEYTLFCCVGQTLHRETHFALMKDLPILHQPESSYLFEFNFVIFDYNYLYNSLRKHMCLHEIGSKWPLKHPLMCDSLA